MATFKCKMCGGALEIADGNNIITCNYCDTKQTLPKLDDNRAGHFRRGNEYDKAAAMYETILVHENMQSVREVKIPFIDNGRFGGLKRPISKIKRPITMTKQLHCYKMSVGNLT